MWFTAMEAAGVLLFKNKTEDGLQDGMSSTSCHNLTKSKMENMNYKTEHSEESKRVKVIEGFSDLKLGQTSELLLKDKNQTYSKFLRK